MLCAVFVCLFKLELNVVHCITLKRLCRKYINIHVCLYILNKLGIYFKFLCVCVAARHS